MPNAPYPGSHDEGSICTMVPPQGVLLATVVPSLQRILLELGSVRQESFASSG